RRRVPRWEPRRGRLSLRRNRKSCRIGGSREPPLPKRWSARASYCFRHCPRLNDMAIKKQIQPVLEGLLWVVDQPTPGQKWTSVELDWNVTLSKDERLGD